MNFNTNIGAKLGISGVFECKDRDGNVLKTIAFNGAIPLEKLGMSVEQAQALVTSEKENGTDHRE